MLLIGGRKPFACRKTAVSQCICDLDIDDNRREQVRHAVIAGKLYTLWVYQDQTQVIGCVM